MYSKGFSIYIRLCIENHCVRRGNFCGKTFASSKKIFLKWTLNKRSMNVSSSSVNMVIISQSSARIKENSKKNSYFKVSFFIVLFLFESLTKDKVIITVQFSFGLFIYFWRHALLGGLLNQTMAWLILLMTLRVDFTELLIRWPMKMH